MSLKSTDRHAQSANDIVRENQLPGDPPTEWDINGWGDPTIQGFGHDISINRGETIFFKIKTDSTDYRIDIYRMGYYGGMGARRVDTVNPSVKLPQHQPEGLRDEATYLYDCGNWEVSASWQAPSRSEHRESILRVSYDRIQSLQVPTRRDSRNGIGGRTTVQKDQRRHRLLRHTPTARWGTDVLPMRCVNREQATSISLCGTTTATLTFSSKLPIPLGKPTTPTVATAPMAGLTQVSLVQSASLPAPTR